MAPFYRDRRTLYSIRRYNYLYYLQEMRALKTDFDDLTETFEEFTASNRKDTGKRSGGGFFNRTSGTVGLGPARSSQICTAYETCPVGMNPDRASRHSLTKLSVARLENVDSELETLKKRHEKLQNFVDEQVVTLSEKHHLLQGDVHDVIQMFKERRRPNLKVENLDMNLIEKMLDDYDQIILDMKKYDNNNSQIMQKTDRLFFLCDELKRTKADNRLIRDALNQKADIEDLHDKLHKPLFDDYVRTSGAQISSLTRQVLSTEAIVRNELGKLLETINTRAARNSVEQLRTYVNGLSETLEEKLHERNAARYAAGTSANTVHCVSCGDNVFQEARQEATVYNGLSPRDLASPYTAYGRNIPYGSAENHYTPRIKSVSPRRMSQFKCQSRRSSRSPKDYSAIIDQHYDDIHLRKNYKCRGGYKGAGEGSLPCGTGKRKPENLQPASNVPSSRAAPRQFSGAATANHWPAQSHSATTSTVTKPVDRRNGRKGRNIQQKI